MDVDQHLRAALAHLYDPVSLSKNPLVRLLRLDAQPNRGAALRSTLLAAIEALRPGPDTPPNVKSWRGYHILRRRCTEQATQRQVAAALGLSKRQVQREEQRARQALADYLRSTCSLAAEALPPPAAAGDIAAPTPAQELAWLQESVPAELADIDAVISGALETLRPLLRAEGVAVEYTAPKIPPEAFLRAPLLRQALLDILTMLMSSAPGGRLRLEVQASGAGLAIRAQAAVQGQAGGDAEGHGGMGKGLDMARQLIHLCGGELRVAPSAPCLEVSVILPNTAQVTVLVIDDNADALQLLEHYLAGSRYRFVGARDARQGLALAEKLAPPIIVLDVMMPAQDGWGLLGQLREHPRTQGSAIVICTILAQEQLAWTLGAAAFMRKPVRRGPLLALLDRLLAPPPPGCSSGPQYSAIA
jgi:CheY-like chemotaxis protein